MAHQDVASQTEANLNRFELEVLRRGLKQPFPISFWQGRSFQLVGREAVLRWKRLILSADKGLGKTSWVQSVFEDIAKDRATFTVLILTTGRGMPAYTRDIQKFPHPEGKIQLITGTRKQRENLWKNPAARYFICTYSTYLEDAGVRGSVRRPSILPDWFPFGVDAVVCDEFHRAFRNRKTKTFDLLKTHFRDTEFFIPMSGSAVSKGPEDLWAALHLCDRKLWSTFWGYANTWCEITDDPHGKTVRGPKLDPTTGWPDHERMKRWRQAVSQNVFHVVAEDVAEEMPPITNDQLFYDLPPWQQKLHDSLLKDQIAELPSGEYLFSRNRLANLHKIRTALICPKAFDPDLGVGSGIETIAEDINESELERAVIFTPFRAPIGHLYDYLKYEEGYDITILQGGIGIEEQERRLSQWREPVTAKTGPKIILSTIKYAESWECPEASYGYFLGYEYDHEDNDQARKRLRRLISTHPVYIQWVTARGSYDERFIEFLMNKKMGKDATVDNWYGETDTK